MYKAVHTLSWTAFCVSFFTNKPTEYKGHFFDSSIKSHKKKKTLMAACINIRAFFSPVFLRYNRVEILFLITFPFHQVFTVVL